MENATGLKIVERFRSDVKKAFYIVDSKAL